MKYIKTYEIFLNKLDKLVDFSKLKKYVIFSDLKILFLDEIIEFNKNNDTIKIKNQKHYDEISDEIKQYDGIENVHFIYLEDLIFMSDNYDKCEKYFNNIIEMKRDAKKYNI